MSGPSIAGSSCALETGSEPAAALKSFLDAISLPGLAASIDPASSLQTGIDPIASVRELAAWIVHAYANDAIRSSGSARSQPAGSGFPPGALDWEEYLGALEEIGYRGFLTIWPAPGVPAATQFSAISRRLEQLG